MSIFNQPVLNGARFEKVMNGLSEEQRNKDTVATIMIVATVTGMKNTAEKDLRDESVMRQENVAFEADAAARLRRQAEACDRRRAKESGRKNVVDALRALLPKKS